jgi:hypothetical protein
MKECTFKPNLVTEKKGGNDVSKSIMNESRMTTNTQAKYE